MNSRRSHRRPPQPTTQPTTVAALRPVVSRNVFTELDLGSVGFIEPARPRAPRPSVGFNEPAPSGPAMPRQPRPSVGFDELPPGQRPDPTGAVDGLIGTAVIGWAYDRAVARRRPQVAVEADGEPVVEVTANGLRRDLAGIDGHDGFSGFICEIPPEKFRAGVVVRVLADGVELANSPLTLGRGHIDGVFEPIGDATASGWVRERVRDPTRAVLDMVVDSVIVRTVVADRLRDELKAHGFGDGRFGFAEVLPASCLDGGEHEIEFRHHLSGTVVAPGARRFRAAYDGALERLDQFGGSGWVLCRDTPRRPIALDVVANGERIGVVADRRRPDVRAARGTDGWGFEFQLPATLSRHREIAVEIFIAGTANPVLPGPCHFTPLSRVVEQLEEVAAAEGVEEKPSDPGVPRPYSTIRNAIVPGILAALRAHDGRSPLPLSLPADLLRYHPPAAAAVAKTVDVVIPVYAGHDETIACIESVLHSVNSTPCEIVVVDDRGPEPKLREALLRYEAAGTITLVVNSANLGFPGAANAGMALHPERDVILLNADTLVPDGWIDRLREAAYRATNIGSVTPLSNRATICSYPEINKDNDLPDDVGWEALDHICAGVNDGVSVEIPTAVGFCTYLKRAVLHDTGVFNNERWQRGYAEENELCILAAAHGWKHVMAPNLFVVHHGAVSFGLEDRKTLLESNLGTLNRLYPDYIPRVMEFLRTDPAAAARRAIDWVRLRRLSDRFVLFVSHRHGGGTTIHLEDLARRLAAQNRHVLILEANADNRGTATIRNLVLGTRSVYSLPQDADALLRDLRDCGIWHIHFHQIMGGERWTLLPSQIGCPYDVTVHDYSSLCPRIDLIDESGRYCGEPAVEVCERCIALNRPHPQVEGAFRDRGGMTEWLRLHRALLTSARRVFVPSADAAARMARHLPGVRYEVRRHPEASAPVPIVRPAPAGPARVAVIGAIGPHKGFDLLLGCAREALKQDLPIQFNLFGYAADETPLRQLANVHLIGEYARADLPRLIAENPCDVALFLSIWPETYCYALSDAYAAGFYPIALRFGALEERITETKVGALLPAQSTPAQINAAILAEIAGADQWPETVDWGVDCPDILADYYGLQP